jgi:Sulfotransferase family
MTAARTAAPERPAAAQLPAGAVTSRRTDPIVVLAYAGAGAELTRSLLARSPELACTSGTGVLPLCEQALLTWRHTEGRDGPPSALALKSIRALTASMITVLLAREGKRRWCEIATAQPAYAETFLCVYPGTRFLCLHRNCADVIRLAMRANPWGLAGPEFGPFAVAYAGYSAAALAAYWTARTRPLLEFEESHLGACRRVRYEDLAAVPGLLPGEIRTFLDLDSDSTVMPGPMHDDPDVAAVGEEAEFLRAAAGIPLDQLPLPLMSEVDDLMARLSYPPLASADVTSAEVTSAQKPP